MQYSIKRKNKANPVPKIENSNLFVLKLGI